MQSFDYAVTLAYTTGNKKILNRLESLRMGVPVKPGVRIPFTFLIHQYSRLQEENLKKKIKLYKGGRTYAKITVGDLLEGIRYVNRIVLISCFEVMEEQKIDVDISALYRSDPNRDSI